MQQFQIDFEYAMLQGTYVARSGVGTSVATGGLVDSTIGISTSTVNAGSAALSVQQINTLLATMAGNGAPMSKPFIIAPYIYLPEISKLFGNQPQDFNIGGVAVKSVITDFGQLGVIGTAQAPANTILVVDMDYFMPVFLPHADGSLIQMKEYTDGSSAAQGWLEAFVGVDFGSESYHGSITSVATPS
jgi:hypothetical protein